MKRTEIVKRLSLAYWKVYVEQLRLADFAKKWKRLGDEKAYRSIRRQAKKEAYRLEGIEAAAQVLNVSRDELQKGGKHNG